MWTPIAMRNTAFITKTTDVIATAPSSRRNVTLGPVVHSTGRRTTVAARPTARSTSVEARTIPSK